MPVGTMSLLGECHEPGSEGTELMGNIAGARLVAQTERGQSTDGARLERSQSAVRARTERGQCAVRARSERGREGPEWMGKKIAGAGAHRQ